MNPITRLLDWVADKFVVIDDANVDLGGDDE